MWLIKNYVELNISYKFKHTSIFNYDKIKEKNDFTMVDTWIGKLKTNSSIY